MRCHQALAETLHAYIKADWERQVAEILDQHNKVRAWEKRPAGFGDCLPQGGPVEKYLPDFVVEMSDGGFLIVEIKGQESDAVIKKVAAERWCRA
jgi:type III restriction enzyme